MHNKILEKERSDNGRINKICKRMVVLNWEAVVRLEGTQHI